MRFVSVNGINLAYYVSGHGTPVLMIQGLGGRAADWGRVPGRLAPRFEVTTLRGCGRVAMWEQPAELAQRLLAFLD
jgi:pimeloyl-ACP methyl ester carboxylesterase